MAKIETIKNEFIEFKVFNASKVLTLFEKLHGKTLFQFFQDSPQNMEGYADALYYGHICASKLESVEPTVDKEKILDSMDMTELITSVTQMLGIQDQAPTDKKK